MCVLKVAEPQTARSEPTIVLGKNHRKTSCVQLTWPGEAVCRRGRAYVRESTRTGTHRVQFTHLSCYCSDLDLGRSWACKDLQDGLVGWLFHLRQTRIFRSSRRRQENQSGKKRVGQGGEGHCAEFLTNTVNGAV